MGPPGSVKTPGTLFPATNVPRDMLRPVSFSLRDGDLVALLEAEAPARRPCCTGAGCRRDHRAGDPQPYGLTAEHGMPST